MGKVSLGPQTWIYPMPALLVGSNINDKPHFMAVAWAGIVNSEPPMISIAIRYNRHTISGIRQNMTFSANVPSVDLVKETDYCGIASGPEANKVEVCRFKVFYGKLKNAPLIEQCPVNLECRVVHTLDLVSHVLFIGNIEETHVSEECLTGGKPDVSKINPLIYSITAPNRQYHTLGRAIAQAHSIGEALRPAKRVSR
ncbi:MAG: flavin reductase family protein [Chloroflexi bacterium]|nr:flavin reductase family protein [Chloroflexota bacterium]